VIELLRNGFFKIELEIEVMYPTLKILIDIVSMHGEVGEQE
jgi:hypothetical protein